MDKSFEQNIKKDTKKYVVIGLLIILGGLGVFLFWAFTAPLTQGVIANGSLTYSDKRSTVQHLYGGTIKELFVKEGSKVKKDDVMMRLDDSSSKAKLVSAKQEYYTAMALEARLMAERLGSPSVSFPAELLDQKDDPDVQRTIKTQMDLFNKRRDSIRNEISILKNQKEGIVDYISQMEHLTKSRNKQIELLEKELDAVKTIADEGYYPRNKLIELQQNMQSILAQKSEELATIERTRRGLAEIDLKISQIQDEFSRDVEGSLTDIQKNVRSLKEQYNAMKVVQDSMEIKSPSDGTVLGLTVHTIGGVVGPGQKIMDIAPLHSDLMIEAQIMPQDIDSVRAGLVAEVRLAALDIRTTPTLFGEVQQISPDVFTDQTGRMSYYLAQVKIPESELSKIGDQHKLQAGMPAQVIIKTGERTLMQYLIKPFMDRFAVSFKEK